jgi:hypothetical protein
MWVSHIRVCIYSVQAVMLNILPHLVPAKECVDLYHHSHVSHDGLML